MRIALTVAGVAATLALPAGAAASPATEIFHRHGLFGSWAVDCSRPPSVANPHVVYRVADGDRVERWVSVEPGRIVDLSTIDHAAEPSPTVLVISWQTREGGVTNRILLRDGRIKVLDSTRSSGEKLFVDGRRVHDRAEAPWFGRCGTGHAGVRLAPLADA
jgi:hypothetical protein